MEICLIWISLGLLTSKGVSITEVHCRKFCRIGCLHGKIIYDVNIRFLSVVLA